MVQMTKTQMKRIAKARAAYAADLVGASQVRQDWLAVRLRCDLAEIQAKFAGR